MPQSILLLTGLAILSYIVLTNLKPVEFVTISRLNPENHLIPNSATTIARPMFVPLDDVIETTNVRTSSEPVPPATVIV